MPDDSHAIVRGLVAELLPAAVAASAQIHWFHTCL